MATSIILLVLVSSLLMMVAFVIKELLRNTSTELKEILDKNSDKNLNNLFGITKTTFLTLIVALIAASIASLTFIEAIKQNKEAANTNIKNTQILQEILHRSRR